MTFRNIQVALTGNSTNLSSVLYKAGNDVEKFHNKATAGNVRTASSAKLMGAAFLAGGAAVALGLGYAVAKAAEFDKAMRNVNSLTQLNEAGFAAMEKQVISMSKALPQSAQVLAEGLYDISSSGFAGAKGLVVLEASAQAASAGLTDTATAAQAITATLNAYGLEAADANDVSDTLFQTVNLGVISFGELSGVIGDVVGTAAAASVGIDQVGSAIATMTLTGISGAEAGTSLNRVLQSVISPSQALSKVLTSLGYESGAAALKQDGLRTVMEKVRVATGGNITTLLELFPEIRAARGALALMANEGQNYARVSADIENKEKRRGATQRALNEQMKAFSNQVQLAKNNIDAIAISGGVKLLPVLLKLMTAAGTLGSALGEGVVGAAHALAPVLSDLVDIVENLWNIGGDLAEVLGPVALAFIKLAATPIVATLAVVAQVLSTLTGLAADHREIVLALIVAYTIFNARALSVAAMRLYSTVVVGLIQGLGALLGATEAATTGFTGLAAAQAAATLGASLFVAGAVVSWMKYRDVQKQAADAVDESSKAISSGSVTALEKQQAALEKTRAELEATISSYTDASFIGRFWQNFTGGAAAAVAASRALDDVDAAIGRVDTTTFKAKDNLARFLQEGMSPEAWHSLLSNPEQLDKVFQDTAMHALEMGGKVTGSYGQMSAALRAYAATHSPAQVAEQKLIDAMGDLADGADDTETAVNDLKNSLNQLIEGPLNQDEALIKWQQALDDLTASVKENGTSLDVHSEKGRNNRQAIIDSVKALKDRITTDAEAGVSSDILARRMENGAAKILETATAAGFSKKQMKDLIAQYGLTPDLIKTTVEAAGATEAEAQIKALQARIDALHGKTVTVTALTSGPLAGKKVPVANGAVFVERYAEGGARLPQAATVAKDGANLVQWAEPGTGGEAFIPLGASKRDRSKQLLATVANMFGMQLLQFADGGTTSPTAVNTAVGVAKIAKGTSAGDSSAEIEKALAAMGKLNQAYEEQRAIVGMNAKERRRYFAEQTIAAKQQTVQARLTIASNREQWRFDHQSAQAQIANLTERMKHEKKYSDAWIRDAQLREQIQQQLAAADAEAARAAAEAAEEQARLAQEHATMLADNRHAWEFEHMSSEQQIADLDRRIATEEQYSDQWLSDMRQREQIINDVAAANRQAAEEAEAALVSLAKFQNSLKVDVGARQQWNQDLLTLATSGHGDLAAQFATMGFSNETAQLAHQAASNPGGQDLDAISRLLTQQAAAEDPRFAQALQLASTLMGSSRPLGIVGLSSASGMSVPDVVGVLETYWGPIFSKLSQAAQVAADRNLIATGQQPSGLARGGIVSSGNTGLYYKWAEPGTGGESLIPLGQSDRPRAIDLWNQTGRMLGVTPTGGGTRSNSVVVAPGAVKVEVSVSGSNLTPADVERAATSATTKAVDSLVQKLRAGVR